MILREHERIDDLGIKNYRIIQNKKMFCFGIDAVLLANYVKTKKTDKIVDLGTGTGIIPIIINGKNEIDEIIGIEIQDEVAEMAKRSVELNELNDKIKILNIDLKDIDKTLNRDEYDVVVSNPPYIVKGKGMLNENDKKTISRHEVKCTLEDICKASSYLLKSKGRLYMIHRPLRLVDIIVSMRKYNLEPKKMRFIHSKMGEEPKLVLIEAIKESNPELRVEEPLYVYNEDESYTDEIMRIYGI